jgi:hypothetical protein
LKSVNEAKDNWFRQLINMIRAIPAFDVQIDKHSYLKNNMFSLFGNPTNVWFESDPIAQRVRIHGKGLSANYHSGEFRYKQFGLTATGAV